MAHPRSLDLYAEANDFLKDLLQSYIPDQGLGTFTPSIYDTAWVAMVSRVDAGGRRDWAFPESFRYVMDTQTTQGGWEGDGSVEDAVMNSLASLLAIKRHQASPFPHTDVELAERVERGKTYLQLLLQTWDILSTRRLLFDIIVPSILGYLDAEGIVLRFPGYDALLALKEKKLSRFKAEIIYKRPTTLLHALEAFIGKLDFSRLAPLMNNGSFWTSPSATAAYLMVSDWDLNAEKYLRAVMHACRKYGEGVVCTAWPTDIFEIAWGTCNLAQNGFDLSKLDQDCLRKIRDILYYPLETQCGLAGWSLFVDGDPDDSAKTITALSYLGSPFTLKQLIKTFEADTHFQSFHFELNPSLSVNCNILIALLSASNTQLYANEIAKAATFICKFWWSSDGIVKDKWHISPYYPAMLAAQGLIRLLFLCKDASLPTLDTDFLNYKLPVTLFQMLLRVLQTQKESGAWGEVDNQDETACAIIALANLTSLPFAKLILPQIYRAVQRGRDYLLLVSTSESFNRCLRPNDRVWVGKVSYGIEHICRSYVLGALHVPVPVHDPAIFDPAKSESSAYLHRVPMETVKRVAEFYRQLPSFSSVPTWKILGWIIEGYLFSPELEKARLDAFPGEEKEHACFDYIPFTWTASNSLDGTYASSQLLLDMMVFSTIKLQIGALLDTVVWDDSALSAVISMVDQHYKETVTTNDQNPSAYTTTSDGATISTSTPRILSGVTKLALTELQERLFNILAFISTYPRISKASINDLAQLHRELHLFLLARIHECHENNRVGNHLNGRKDHISRFSVLNLVRGKAGDHLGIHCSFSFLTCLLGHAEGLGKDYFPTPEIKYMARDCITHVSSISWLSDSCVSLQHDNKEKGMDAAVSSESHSLGEDRTVEGRTSAMQKGLVQVLKYERKCLAISLSQMQEASKQWGPGKKGGWLYKAVGLFCNACEVQNEIRQAGDFGISS